MSNTEDTNTSEEEQHLEKDIVKETNKPKYFLEETNELIKVQDYTEIELMAKRQAEMIIIGSCCTNRSWKLIAVSPLEPWDSEKKMLDPSTSH